MPTADSLSFEILKTGENQVKILVIRKTLGRVAVYDVIKKIEVIKFIEGRNFS